MDFMGNDFSGTLISKSGDGKPSFRAYFEPEFRPRMIRRFDDAIFSRSFRLNTGPV